MKRWFTRNYFLRAAVQVNNCKYKYEIYGVIDWLGYTLTVACNNNRLSDELNSVGPMYAAKKIARLKMYILEHISVSDTSVDLLTMRMYVEAGLRDIVSDLISQQIF